MSSSVSPINFDRRLTSDSAFQRDHRSPSSSRLDLEAVLFFVSLPVTQDLRDARGGSCAGVWNENSARPCVICVIL